MSREPLLTALLLGVALPLLGPSFFLWLVWVFDGPAAWNAGWHRYYLSMVLYVPAFVLACVILRARESELWITSPK